MHYVGGAHESHGEAVIRLHGDRGVVIVVELPPMVGRQSVGLRGRGLVVVMLPTRHLLDMGLVRWDLEVEASCRVQGEASYLLALDHGVQILPGFEQVLVRDAFLGVGLERNLNNKHIGDSAVEDSMESYHEGLVGPQGSLLDGDRFAVDEACYGVALSLRLLDYF